MNGAAKRQTPSPSLYEPNAKRLTSFGSTDSSAPSSSNTTLTTGGMISLAVRPCTMTGRLGLLLSAARDFSGVDCAGFPSPFGVAGVASFATGFVTGADRFSASFPVAAGGSVAVDPFGAGSEVRPDEPFSSSAEVRPDELLSSGSSGRGGSSAFGFAAGAGAGRLFTASDPRTSSRAAARRMPVPSLSATNASTFAGSAFQP